MPSISIIDDDQTFCGLMSELLRREGFQPQVYFQSEPALRACISQPPDLILLDVMMPQLDGFSFLKKLRQVHRNLPVLMLSARGEDIDSITGLETGADDYLAKPFNPSVLLARIRALLRRYHGESATNSLAASGMVLHAGALELHRAKRQAHYQGDLLALTATEFALLEALVHAAIQAKAMHDPRLALISKDKLSLLTLGRDYEKHDRSVDMHLSNLRHKLGRLSEALVTVRGVGYQWVEA
jgi:two-component system OmpR family response regulator